MGPASLARPEGSRGLSRDGQREEIVFRAIGFAAEAHRGQRRKGTRVPYLTHLLEVARILAREGLPPEVVAAGVLHDTLEDTPVSSGELRRRFGPRVAELVESVSEPDKSLPWEVRKRHTLQHLPGRGRESLAIALADKLHNLRSIREEQARLGEGVWGRFSRPRRLQERYYRSLAGVFLKGLEADSLLPLALTFLEEVREVFRRRRWHAW